MGGVKLHVIGDSTPLARAVLRVLRDESTGYSEFREYMRRAGVILAVAASRSLSWRTVKVRTPLNVEAEELEPARSLYVIGILGASLPLVEGFLEMYPWARVALLAARRIEEEGSVRVEVYYERMPRSFDGDVVIVDPMLATGLTVEGAIRAAKERGADRIVVACVIASKPGVERISRNHPDVEIYALALDPQLDHRFFIVPGLGDAGDRALGVSP
jgi:uracil phosphoribosyltransferase